VLFNRIEANAYLNNTAACLTDLNTYISKRVSGFNASTHKVTANSMSSYFGPRTLRDNIISTVLAFKRVEFVQEGMRWFDMQRYNIPVTHTTKGGSVINVPAGDLRRILQIPQTASISGIEQNPR
jgi:starch-binding outer membrane protein, SusD/RagB family